MAEKILVEPDVDFIKQLGELGGESLKKCYQCATCSVVCPISPDIRPFPRKEMISASWGLKDKIIKNGDIWLCHNCGDCTTQCPRGAKPGDVMAAARMYTIMSYAPPKALGKAVNDPKKLPIVGAIPAAVFLVLGLVLKLFGVHWLNFTPGPDPHGEIAHHMFFSTWLVDLVFIPLSIWVIAVFALGLKRFIADIHENALSEGKTQKQTIEPVEFLKAIGRVIPVILKHNRFSECGENNERSTPHMMVLFSFIGLFIVTSIFFVVLYGFGVHGPYSQLNPVKILANISGIALVIGAILLMRQRAAKTDQVSTYQDWYLLWMVLGVGATGMLAELTRLADAAFLTYLIYFIHLMFVFNLIAFLPYSKLAHLVYRTVAMGYSEYSGRDSMTNV
ncbi:MAG: quinone-interacting membrane-bound oxidoreductase complex subunit QmoC [Desulfobacterales bacterium]|nr:quinone-interacting membrane-bound oxidoreductase complex subunit QmoC [Desulfobacterales bacterium]